MDTKEKKRKTKTQTAPPERRKRTEQSKLEEQVVYTQAKPFNLRRLLLRLATILAIVLALIFGLSIFFKVDKIEVYGAEKYESWQIAEASGIEEGEGLLGINGAKVSARITTALPYVKQVRVELSLPDKVKIEIVESDIAYAITDHNGDWWLMDAQGKMLERIDSVQAMSMTQILGVQIQSPVAGQSAVAVEPVPTETDADGMTIPVTIRGSERLDAVLTILGSMEDNGILGQMASVDVSDMGDIELWYETRYQILLGDTSRLEYKIKATKQVIDQNGEYGSGILDVTFITWPDKVGCMPLS